VCLQQAVPCKGKQLIPMTACSQAVYEAAFSRGLRSRIITVSSLFASSVSLTTKNTLRGTP
jgi:hypothetical protein